MRAPVTPPTTCCTVLVPVDKRQPSRPHCCCVLADAGAITPSARPIVPIAILQVRWKVRFTVAPVCREQGQVEDCEMLEMS